MTGRFVFQTMIVICLLTSCNKQKKSIIRVADYEKYLTTGTHEAREKAEAEKDFWENKLAQHPDQYTYLQPLAAAYTTMFEVSGDIDCLLKADTLLVQANARQNQKNAALQRTLARNYITQHRFKEALALLKKAENIGEKLKATQKMLFDVHLELGNTAKAEHYLAEIKALNEFDYLIRLSKWSDHTGNLEAAIKYLEKAVALAEDSHNQSLQLWGYSNLADFYGHAGRIEDAYNYYLKVLEIDPDYTYALKGIAWIAFSHEKNIAAANRILDAIAKKHETPDLYLLKAELAEYAGDETLRAEHLEKYRQLLEAHHYGVMYDKYNTLLWAEDEENTDKALTLAQREVANRPTAQSYDLLAWAYFKKGDAEQALNIAREHVAGKTSEPEVQYHLAEIYKANGMEKEVKTLKKELLESRFELGPNMEKRILGL